MSGIMINESFNDPKINRRFIHVYPPLADIPLRGGWKTNNREQSKKTMSYN
jgi:hypothetical protein